MESWILIAYLLVGSASPISAGPKTLAGTSTEFGTQETCQAALQTIKAVDATGINIISAGCYRSGFVHKDGIRMPKVDK